MGTLVNFLLLMCGVFALTAGLYYFIGEHIDELQFVVLKETTNRDKWEEHYISLFKPKFNYKGVDVPYRNEVA